MNASTRRSIQPPRWPDRLARLGQLGFIFFFLKGLVWLGVLGVAWVGIGGQ